MSYCALSAMPVGRFVLDVHGESPSTWAASDAICAALQVINHLQDCGADYRDLDRVYLPLDILASHGARRRSAGSEDGVAGLALLHRRTRGSHSGIAPRGRWAGRRHRRLAVAGRDFRHSRARDAADARARREGPARRRDPSQQVAGGVDRSPRRFPRRDAWLRSSLSPGRLGVADMTLAIAEPVEDGAARASGSSFYLAMRIMPAEATPGDVRDLFVLPGGRRHRRQWRPARGSDRAAAALARRSRRDLCGRAAAAPARAGPGDRNLPAPARGLHGGDRRHGDGRVVDDSRRRIGRRSISIATASPAPSAGSASACSEWTKSPALRWRITWAARCN